MKCAIMQPTYIPWIGYFAMIDAVDIFIFLDNVQLEKRSWQIRNRIKQRGYEELLLSIPVHTVGRDDTKILDATFATTTWIDKHLLSIKYNYKKAQFYEEIISLLEKQYYKQINKLADFNINFITSICDYLGIRTKFARSSELKDISGNKDELLVSICKKISINTYLSAKSSSLYIEKFRKGGAFSASNITLEYQNYKHPVYKQLGHDFIPYLSIVDLLFNNGKKSLEILRSGVFPSYTSDTVFLSD